MFRKVCKAKNPSMCRFHGNHVVGIDFGKNVFLTNSNETFTKNLEESQTYKMLLTSEEEEAIQGYCSQDYMNINKYLYDPSFPLSESLKKKIVVLDSALGKFPVREQRRLFRGSSLQLGVNGYEGFSSPEEVEKYLDKNFAVGGVVDFVGFSSTTENPHCLVDFCSRGYDDVGERTQVKYSREEFVEQLGKTNEVTGHSYDPALGNIVYVFSSGAGVPLTDFGQTYAKKEQEVLLPRNTKFRIKSVHSNKLFNFVNQLSYGDRVEKRLINVIELEEIVS